MKALLVCLLLLSTVKANFYVGEEDGILILDSATFTNAINFYENIIVEFYADWCGHCKKFSPKYIKACKILRTLDTPVYCAKINGDTEKAIAEKEYKVNTFPTVKYFKGDEVLDYEGAYNEHALLSWVKTGEAESTVTIDHTDIDRLRESEDVVWVFFGDKKSSEYKQFNMISKHDENRLFFNSNDPVLIEKYDIKTPTMVTFRKFDEPVVKLDGEWDRLAVMNFIRASGKAKCMNFKEIDKTNIFKAKDKAIFLFIDEARDQALIDTFCSVAISDTSPMMYVYAGIEEYEHNYLRKYINMHEKEVPSMAAIKWEVAYGMMRYDYDGDVSQLKADHVTDFKKRFLNGALERDYFDDQADTWYHLDNPATIIREEYETIVLDADNDVLVYYFSSYNVDKKTQKIFHGEINELQKELGRPDHLIIGRYDWHRAPPVHGTDGVLQNLVLYPKDRKDKGIIYKGEDTVEDIKDWLYEHSTEYQKLAPRNDDL